MNPDSDFTKICGLDVFVVTPCRCGSPLFRVHPHSTKSEIPIWKCVWCRERLGKVTEVQAKLLEILREEIRLAVRSADLPRRWWHLRVWIEGVMHQREIRLALLRNGHLPIPVQGKRPLLQNWQNLDPDEEMIARWGDQGDNTGVLCRRTAALDIDFDDAAAVQIVLAVVRDRIRGLILERTGRAPKCAVPMYVPEPFKKVIRKFTAPDGRVHKIEFLCDGQQFVVAGTHPDTGSPYTWRDRDLMGTSLMELPVVRESDIEALLQRCAEELKV